MQKMTVTPDGTVTEDYVVPDDAKVRVVLKSGWESYEYSPSEIVDGNKVVVRDNGTLPVGVYAVHVYVREVDGGEFEFRPLHSGFPSVITIRPDNTGVTDDYTDFVDGSVLLDAQTYIFAKGEKGDPFTYEDFTPEQIAELQRPVTEIASEVAAQQAQWEQAELTRQRAEMLRNTNEVARQESERLRAEDERERSAAEGQRQSQEQQRQQDTQTAISNAEQATLEAENVNARLSSDGGVVILTITNRQGNQSSKEVGFRIYKTYPSVAAMNADLANVEDGRFVMIAGDVEDADTGKLYVRGASAFTFITDLSGAQGIKGDDGNGIASVTLNADYTLTIVFTDGASTTTTSIRGAKGDPGTTDYNKLENKPVLAAVATSGSYNDLNDKPVIPVVPTNVSAFNNDAGYLTQHQDISGKEDLTTIVPVTTEMSALTTDVGKYYRIDVPVETLAVTLPAMTDNTTVRTVVIYLTAGTTPAITITSADSKDVYYQDGFEIETGSTYEINALFNGSAWVVAGVKIVVPEVEEGGE